MAITFRFTPDDMKMGILVDPTWYTCRVEDVTEAEALDGSKNIFCDLKILDQPDSKSDFRGVTVRRCFNEKGKGYASSYVLACGGKLDITKEQEIDFERTKGKVIKVYIGRRKDKDGSGKQYNDPSDFRSIPQQVA